MTKQILLSFVALLAILVTVSSAVESKDEPMSTNDLIVREARAAEPGGEGKNQIKNKSKNKKRKAMKVRKNKKRKAMKVRKNNKRKAMKVRKNNSKEKKNKNSSKSKGKKEKKGNKDKLDRQNDSDGNIICPECPKSANTICKPKSGRKFNKKEKKLFKKMKKVDRKIAKINRRIRKSRNGEEVDDDKLCKPCCDKPTTTPPPPPPPSPTPPPPPTTTGPCDECLKESVTGMDVWRVQVTNFQKQCKRVKRQTDIATSKAGKTDSFTELATLLEQFDTPQECPNNYTEIIKLKSTLGNCSTDVPAACNLTMVNQTFKDECIKKTDDYVVRTEQ